MDLGEAADVADLRGAVAGVRVDEDEGTPSKLIKLNTEPSESPSDKLSRSQIRKHVPMKKAIKFAFTKASEDETGDVLFEEEEVKKIFTSQDSFPSTCMKTKSLEIASFYFCKMCGNFPRVAKFNQKCKHIYCAACIENFQENIETSKCPATNEDDEACSSPIEQLLDLTGLVSDIHSSLKVFCNNAGCEELLTIGEIDQHETNCHKRGIYTRKSTSVSHSRSTVLKGRVEEIIVVLLEWCDKYKVSPCDLLLFALKRNIQNEAPELAASVGVLFNQFLASQGPAQDKNEVTPLMGLALKLNSNLSARQYEKLASYKVLGKLPGIRKIRKAADKLDPGNVSYQVLSRETGEVLKQHEAIPGSGLIDADTDFGQMSFGDLNPNIHGFRASLHDSICKLFEEHFPEIHKEVEKRPAVLADSQRVFKAFCKVGFDGTSAPVKSDKGSTRLSVSNWLRGTLCLVAVQVVITFDKICFNFSTSG